jgi:hypothetical protein
MRKLTGFIIVLAVLLCVSPAFAQNSNSGDIRGTVTDATGAVVPGVTVTVLDVDKDFAKTYETNGAGLYDTGSIVTDHYTITFTKEGFDTFVRGPITLQVETLTIDGTLKVGATTETVRVTIDVPLLQTESAAQSTIMAEEEMDDLPNFASWENFIILAPGAAGAPGAGNGVNPGQTASVNGNAVFYNLLGDGVTMSLPSNGNGYDYNFDSLSEVQMITNAFSAQYENGGVIYNQISKGGGSQYHGDIFDYFQNSALNAAPFGFGGPVSIPPLRANYFGGSIGGPVPGPLKKKLFFFFNYNYSQSYGGNPNSYITVPTAAMLNGDFTGQPTIYDPTTQTIDSSGNLVRQSFASEYGNGNKIPSNMISSVAQAMQSYFPKPNVANPNVKDGITTNNYVYNIPTNSPGWSYFWRADYDITPKNRLTVTDFYNKGTFNELSPDCPINCTNAHGSGITGQISDVWTFNSRDINEFRMGVSIQNNLFIPQSIGKGYPGKLGMLFAKADLFPEVNISGGCCWGLGPGTNAIQHQIMFEPSDVVTMIRGKHVLHFGGEFLDQQINTTLWGNVDAGSASFTGVYTNSTQGDGATGLPYADFLLGDVQSWSSNNTPEFYPRMKTVQLFVQDDFKVRPNLTLNLGVRWEGWNGMSEKNGNERSWDPTITNPADGSLGAMWYGGTPGSYRSKVIAGTWGNFMPRMGFSWQKNSKTVIRGGIGLYAYNYQEGPHAYNEIGFKEGQSGNLTDATNGILPVVRLDEDGSINDQGPGGSSINSVYLNAPTGAASLNGQSVNYAYYHEPLSKIWQYNLEVQRELTPNMVVNIAYVGSHGFDQLFGVDLNQIPADKLSVDDINGCLGGVGPCYRPYPNYQSIGGSKLIGISNYNALQATIQKRLSYGLLFNFNYSWSHYLDEADPCAWNCATTTVQNMYDPRANYGPSAFDIRQMFKGRLVYKLPAGKGQRFLNNSSILSQVLGGWQTAATMQWQTGNPFTPYMDWSADNNYSQSGYQYPDIIGNPHSGPHGTIAEWFNVAAYKQPDVATYGNVTRNSLYGPHLSVVNFSLSKSFSFLERGKFELRIDTSNLFNHPSFGLPDNVIGPGHNAQITSLTVGGRAVELIGKISF